ncbi:hypothetical protein BHM03_00036012, partial [Ensete ventricosum]
VSYKWLSRNFSVSSNYAKRCNLGFCGVSNSFVKRIVDGKHVGAAAPWPMNGKGVATESKGISTVKGQPVQHPQQGSGAKNVSIAVSSDKSEKVALDVMQSSIAVSSDKSEKVALDAVSKATKPPLIKESVSGGNTGKNKGQNVKSLSGTTSSLASLWGNASAKSKPVTPAAETTIDTSIAAGIWSNNMTYLISDVRPPVANKAQAAGTGASTNPGKGGNKKPGKGGPKDGKQGNILSFFKRV